MHIGKPHAELAGMGLYIQWQDLMTDCSGGGSYIQAKSAVHT